MPTVAYLREPHLGRLGSAPDATDCSTWDFFFNKASWEACVAAAERAQLQQTAQNITNAYGVVDPAAQSLIDRYQQQAPADAANVADFYGAGTISAPTLASSTPLLVWLAIAGVSIWVGLKVLNAL